MPVPFPYIANVARVVLRSRRDGNERISVLYYKKNSGPFIAGDMLILATQVEDKVGSAIAGITCLGTEFVDVTATDITEENGAQATIGWSAVASGGADVLPANVALCLIKHTGLSGRRNRGRFFCYDLSEDLFNGSTLNPLSLAPVNAMQVALAEDLAAGAFRPVVASHTYGTANEITTVTNGGIAGTMSKRLPGRGS